MGINIQLRFPKCSKSKKSANGLSSQANIFSAPPGDMSIKNDPTKTPEDIENIMQPSKEDHQTCNITCFQESVFKTIPKKQEKHQSIE